MHTSPGRTWSGSFTRQWLCAVALAPVFLGVHALAYALRFDFEIPPERWWQFCVTAACAVVVKLLVFAWFGAFRGWRRFVTFHDVVILGKASLVSTLLLLMALYVLLPGLRVPRSVALSDLALTIGAVGGLRSLVRLMQERHAPVRGSFRGDAGVHRGGQRFG